VKYLVGKHVVTFGDFAIQSVGVEVAAHPEGGCGLCVGLRAVSVTDGRLIDVNWAEKLDHVPDDPRVLGELVRAAALNALMHEVDEHLRVNGVLVREPHPEEPT
jgi:hypothetical protein